MIMLKADRGSKCTKLTFLETHLFSMLTPRTGKKKFFKKEKRSSRLSKLAPSVAPSEADFDNPPDLGQNDDIEVRSTGDSVHCTSLEPSSKFIGVPTKTYFPRTFQRNTMDSGDTNN